MGSRAVHHDTEQSAGESKHLNVSKLNEECDSLIHSLLEQRGKFQTIVIVLLCLNSIIIGINHTITTFHVYVPDFFCTDDPAVTCYDNGTQCVGGYTFDEKDDLTVAVEFSTVCDRSMLAPLINSLYFVGVTFGSLICSSLCDVYGRHKLVLICLYGQALMAIGQYYSLTLTAFIVYRFLQGFFIQGLQTCSYTLAMEYCPSRYRTIVATYWESNWAIGLGLLGLVSYFVREWRLLTLILTAPALISLAYVWIIPESILWLRTNGRQKEAMNILYKIAKFNRQSSFVDQCNAVKLAEIAPNNDVAPSSRSHKDEVEKVNFCIVVKNAVLRKHLLSMICVWFSVTLSYYGILFYIPHLAGQRHLNFEIGALIELIAYILAYFILGNFGRRLPMTFYQYCNGILILIIAIFTTLPEDSYNSNWVAGIALFAKGLAVSSFCGMFIYCSELLPTVCRGLGLGLCGCAARCGSLLAPLLMALMNVMPHFIPLSIMSIFLIISATVTLFLPETLSTILPNTIAEADSTWRKK